MVSENNIEYHLDEKRFIRVLQSKWDLQQSLSALTFLLEDCDFEKKYNYVELRKFKCYEANMIVSFARPFEQTRSGVVLGLKKIGIELSDDEKSLKNLLLYARKKIIAHSDDDYMHFKAEVIELKSRPGFYLPSIIYDETLLFGKEELLRIEMLLLRLRSGIEEFLFNYVQKKPDLMNVYKQRPESYLKLKKEN